MALINFNNAHIEVINTNCFTSSDNAYWYLNLGMRQYNVLTGETINLTSSSVSVVDVNTNGFKVIRTGTFASAGNALAITNKGNMTAAGTTNTWLITNIEYEAGDTFSFQIDVNLNYET